jgi:MraZ protein
LAIVDLFLGNALNAVDAKGRVSLPSGYRSVIEKRQLREAPGPGDARVERAVSFIAHPQKACLVGFDNSVASLIMEQLQQRRAQDASGGLFAVHDAGLGEFSATLVVTYDPDGRMTLPGYLRDKAGIGDLAFFVPAGHTFELWSPGAFAAQTDPRVVNAQDQLAYMLAERRK